MVSFKMKKIKVFFNKTPYSDFNVKNYFPFAVLFNNFNAEIVKDYREADVIFEMVCVGGRSFLNEKNKIIIIVSGENIFMKRNLFIWLERFVNILFGNEKKYKIMDRLNSLIPYRIQDIKLSYYFPEYLKFLKDLDKNSNHYAILCNKEINHEKIYNYPLFLADFHHLIPKLIKKNIKSNPSNKKFCAFAVSSNSSRDRIRFFKMLSKYKKVDSYGRVMNNMGPEFIKHWVDNPKLFSQYKFVICFENSYVGDFITEKITNAMLSGAIPIYHGPKNTKEYFNTASFINLDDYGSYEKMVEKVIELDKDDKKYNKFLKTPWFYENKIPKSIKEKEKELIEFYKMVLKGLK